MKNNNKFLAAIISLAICLVIFTAAGFSPKKSSATSDQDSISSDQIKNPKPKRNTRQIASVQGRDQLEPFRKNVVQFHQELSNLLGRDEIGKVSLDILMFGFLEHESENVNLEQSVCRLKEKCKVDLESLYTHVFEKLNLESHSPIKALFQEQMLLSDLDDQVKIRFLVSELAKTEVGWLPATSHRNEKGEPVVGDNTLYLLATLNQLIQLSDDTDLVINSGIMAIKNLRDSVGQLLLKTSLCNEFPEHSSQIEYELDKLGAT